MWPAGLPPAELSGLRSHSEGVNRKSASSLEQGWTKYFKNQKGFEMTLPKWESVLWSYKHTCQIIFEKPKKTDLSLSK